MIELKCVEIVDLSEWTNEGPGFTVTVTDGTSEFDLRIDADSDIFGTDAPAGVFSVSGIGGQFDSSSPYDDGYQLQPRYLEDISDAVTANFEAPSVIIIGENVTFTNLSEGATSYLWNFGNGVTSDEFEPTTVFNSVESFTVTLTAFNSTCNDQFTFEVDVNVGVDELELHTLNIYPVPANDLLYVQSGSSITHVAIYDLAGRKVQEQSLNGGKTAVTLDIQGLAAGSYVLTASFENGSKGMRFVKQ
jgi:PKD repeat protein